MDSHVLVVPGWQNSGPTHWQSLWESEHPHYRRVVQTNWDEPDLGDWVRTLEHAISDAPVKPVIIGHSLGCITIVHWAALHDNGTTTRLAGALLVAPADVEQSESSQALTGFAPIPVNRLRFPSIVVGSRNDPYASFDRCTHFAHVWGSELIDAGLAGHLNAAAGFGPWPAGERLLGRIAGGA